MLSNDWAMCNKKDTVLTILFAYGVQKYISVLLMCNEVAMLVGLLTAYLIVYTTN